MRGVFFPLHFLPTCEKNTIFHLYLTNALRNIMRPNNPVIERNQQFNTMYLYEVDVLFSLTRYSNSKEKKIDQNSMHSILLRLRASSNVERTLTQNLSKLHNGVNRVNREIREEICNCK